MQKALAIIFGILGIVLLVELGVLVWQRNISSPHLSTSLSPSPSLIPTVTPSALPNSNQNKSGIKLINFEDYMKKGYISWQDADFFYNIMKEDKIPVPPFSVMGVVKKIGDKQLEIEAKGNGTTMYIVKAELSPNSEIIKHTRDSAGKLIRTSNLSYWQEIKIGSQIRLYPLTQESMENGYYIVTKIYIIST